MRAPLAAVLALALVACRDERPPARNDEVARLLANVTDAGPPAVEPAVLAAAREAQKAAAVLAGNCALSAQYEETFRVFTDFCRFQPKELAALREATAKLRALAPDAGAPAIYLAHLTLFTGFLDHADGSDPLRKPAANGVLARYQDLARAWNVFAPDEPVPVDVGRLSYETDENLIVVDAGPDAGHLVWKRCSDGPCLVVPVKNDKLHPERVR